MDRLAIMLGFLLAMGLYWHGAGYPRFDLCSHRRIRAVRIGGHYYFIFRCQKCRRLAIEAERDMEALRRLATAALGIPEHLVYREGRGRRV